MKNRSKLESITSDEQLLNLYDGFVIYRPAIK